MTAQFRNLVFEGGGVKGIAYVGAMQVLARRGYLDHITRVGGTSAGAINALMFALGYDIKTQRSIIGSADFNEFMDNSFLFIRDLNRLWSEFGWNKGDFFVNWIGGYIREQLGDSRATFADLAAAGHPELYVIGTNLSTGYSEVFSAERHADMPLVEALRISMSIPLFYRAVRHGPRKDVYVDGGVLLNYPVKLFDRERYIDMAAEPEAARRADYYERENDRFLLELPGRSPYVYNRQTLGLRLETREDIGLFRYDEPPRGDPIDDFGGYAKALIRSLLRVQENQHLHGDDWKRTLYIDTLDVETTDFNLSDPKKAALIEQGIQGAETFLGWFEDPKNTPPNRLPEAGVPRVKLQRGASGEAVVQLQSLMNRAGTMLVLDGDFGPGTERAVTHCQSWAGQPQSGVVDEALWEWLAALPEPFPPLPTEGVAFIAREETGGLAYYQDHTRWPHYPGEASGITIGMGYDLRMNTLADFKRDWASVLPKPVFKVLALDIGKAGTKKRAKALKEVGIDIPFNQAWQVFTATTLPRYYDLTLSIYPSLDRLPPLCRAVLVSIVFNRGASLRGDSRREMKTIQTLLEQADQALPDTQRWKAILTGVEDQIVAMKRLWGTGSGLVKRRQAEANLWRQGLEIA
ncbi:MAG TPA: patatin-like phospholipase family protein [Saccharospirillum sp.]|nr:patatin-like phospholipase family protein [Saccharospirillum sp.]